MKQFWIQTNLYSNKWIKIKIKNRSLLDVAKRYSENYLREDNFLD